MIKVFQTSGWCYIAPSNREPVMILKDGSPAPLALESLIRGERIFKWVHPPTKEKVSGGHTYTVACKITAADIRAQVSRCRITMTVEFDDPPVAPTTTLQIGGGEDDDEETL